MNIFEVDAAIKKTGKILRDIAVVLLAIVVVTNIVAGTRVAKAKKGVEKMFEYLETQEQRPKIDVKNMTEDYAIVFEHYYVPKRGSYINAEGERIYTNKYFKDPRLRYRVVDKNGNDLLPDPNAPKFYNNEQIGLASMNLGSFGTWEILLKSHPIEQQQEIARKLILLISAFGAIATMMIYYTRVIRKETMVDNKIITRCMFFLGMDSLLILILIGMNIVY